MVNRHKKLLTGFTLVELLIVIVLIAILASLSVVAYNGIQARAEFSVMRSDIGNIQRAIEMYKSIHGEYPDSQNCTHRNNGWCGWDQRQGDGFIPGLVPEIMHSIPTLDTKRENTDTYIYQSRGADCQYPGADAYQLMRFNLAGLNNAELSDDNTMKITGDGYDGIAWGVKSNNCSNWW